MFAHNLFHEVGWFLQRSRFKSSFWNFEETKFDVVKAEIIICYVENRLKLLCSFTQHCSVLGILAIQYEEQEHVIFRFYYLSSLINSSCAILVIYGHLYTTPLTFLVEDCHIKYIQIKRIKTANL